MEVDPKKLDQLIHRYEAATARLIEADRELASLRDDQYVTWEWVCWYLNIGRTLAERLLADQPVFVFAKGVERFLRSDIILFAKQKRAKVDERALFYLKKTPIDKSQTFVSKTLTFKEEMRERAEVNMMKYRADNDKRIDRRRAWEEKQKGKELKNSKSNKPKPHQ